MRKELVGFIVSTRNFFGALEENKTEGKEAIRTVRPRREPGLAGYGRSESLSAYRCVS